MGLGLHGGGVATAKWLVMHGATVTATDKRTEVVLAPSVHALKGTKVRFVLGKHNHGDFRTHNLIIANPGVPRESEYLATAIRAKKRIENDASLFFRFIQNPVIAVTGTRGKTTTTLWIAELLKKKYPAVRPSGNTPDNALLKEFDRVNGKGIPVATELSSWQLEYAPQAKRGAHIAVITNLFADHLNRYDGDITQYADAKAGIFAHQSSDDFLILNADNKWWKYFANKKPRARIFMISTKPLPRKFHDGLFVRNGNAVLRMDNAERTLCGVERFAKERGAHNLANLLSALLATTLFDAKIRITERDILRLPSPPMRQEIVLKQGRLTVVNDSCATSPDGVIAALERFLTQGNVVLITGGTDKELEFQALARAINKNVPTTQLVLLEGSATSKLISVLSANKPISRLNLDKKALKNLDSCVAEAFRVAHTLKGKTTILFSPGAASFEKFLHEFDRGAQFNALVKKYTK